VVYVTTELGKSSVDEPASMPASDIEH